MFSSIGYHTFAISMNLTQEGAGLLLRDFKKYRDRTKEICIIECPRYKADPFGRHWEIKYPDQYKGIGWKIRFSNRGFLIDDEFMTCSIKAIINPKILAGEKSYIMAAHAGYLEIIEKKFNEEAAKISPILKRFDDYSLNRLDYCINFDISELEFWPKQSAKNMSLMLMKLIKCGDIPKNFSEEYKDNFQFYLKSGTVVINCYWKYGDLVRNFAECNDLEKSYDIIRFEVQYKYPKVHESLGKIKKEFAKFRSGMINNLGCQFVYESGKSLNGVDRSKFDHTLAMIRGSVSDSQLEKMYIMSMMSDEKCIEVIKKYWKKTIRPGAYYTFETARRKIEENVPNWEKIIRLTDALKRIRDRGGIARAKEGIWGKELEEFRRSLRDLANLGINPVTIPEEWDITYIPNLLDAYYNKLAKEQEKIAGTYGGMISESKDFGLCEYS